MRTFLLLTAITFPVWPLLAGKILGMSRNELLWLVVILLGPAWLYGNLRGFMQWGLAAFAFSAYLSPLVLVLFVRFLERPNWKQYSVATGAVAVQATMHVLGPVVVSLAMLSLTVFAEGLTRKWRILALVTPLFVGVLCSFWLLPFVLDLRAPQPDLDGYYPPDLTYFSVRHLLDMISPLRAIALLFGVGAAVTGLVLFSQSTSRITVWAFGIAIATGLVLKFGGSFLPVIVEMQPARFLLPTFALMCIPAAVATQRFCSLLRIPDWIGAPGLGLLLLAMAIGTAERGSGSGTRTHTDFAGRTTKESPTFLSLPVAVPQPHGFEELIEFVREKTGPGDRLLLQTRIQAEQTILPHLLGREIIGNAYPNTADRSNFLLHSLWGSRLTDWQAEDLREAVQRWRIRWVIGHTEKAKTLLRAAFGPGAELGPYEAFEVPSGVDSGLAGSASVQATVNRIEVTEITVEGGLVVIPYRYHPAFTCDEGSELLRYPVPEDPMGFIAIRDPPQSVTLRFRPRRLFTARWQDPLTWVRTGDTEESDSSSDRTLPPE